jgi:hypothetical protein
METKFIAGLTAIALLLNPLSASAAGRRMVSAKTAQQGFQVSVSSQGVAIAIPGEQITFIQLSHLSNFVCTTDNGNMCVSGGGTANLIYLRRIQLGQQVPGQIASPDGSTLLLLKTNGGSCSAICPITLVPSSSVPRFNVIEIGGVAPEPIRPIAVARTSLPRAIAPAPVPGLPPAPPPPLRVDLPTDFKSLEEVQSSPVIKQELPAPEQTAEKPIKVKVPKRKGKKLPRVKNPKTVIEPPVISPPVEAPVTPVVVKQPVAKLVLPKADKMPSRVLANKIVMGLAHANRSREIPYASVKSLKVQNLVRMLRRDRPLAKAIKMSGLSEKDVNRLIQLGTKR